MKTEENIVLEVEGLKQYFPLDRKDVVRAVDGVSFRIRKGTTFGLVGESGSGKSTIGRSIIRLYDPTEGTIRLNGKEISGKLTKEKKSYLTHHMQMIFQDPMSSLNPRKKVIDIVAEGLDANHLYSSKKEREEKVYRMLERVGLNKEQANRYPHMFSGGQRQRIGIARAMIMEPDLIIADECISALDVSIQAQVINIMKELQEEQGLTYLFIAHDLAMVKYISDEIGVMHRGHFVEMGTREEIFQNPVHPYTKSLLSAIPEPNPKTEPSRKSLSYDMRREGIDYTRGSRHWITDSHMVLATEEEFKKWT
ncbi:MAG: ATP-binding cassette domain-containing protein [Eubacteriales bacterium]|nr:ATP-binding cassette domain-containing protein [Eubacteriales bacterium]